MNSAAQDSPAATGARKPLPKARLAAVAAVLATLIALLVLLFRWFAARLVHDPGLPEPWDGAALWAIGGMFGCLVAGPVFERLPPYPWRRVGCVAAWIGVGVLFVGTWVLALADLASAVGLLPVGAGAKALGVVAATLGIAGFATVSGLGDPALERVSIDLARWPAALDGFRIAQISDIHIGPILGAGFARRLTERVNALEADLVVITGDLVDGPVDQVGAGVGPFRDLAGRHGVFFVTGNHDVYSGDEAWVARVRELGITPLRNAHRAFDVAGARFDLAGVDDHRGDWVTGTSEDLPAALAGRDPAVPVILLAHDPSTFKKARRAGVDLQLSGHTHGGQIWPFRYLVRIAVRWVSGVYRDGDSTIYVSRGTGFWGPPLRLFAPAELTEITLRSGSGPLRPTG